MTVARIGLVVTYASLITDEARRPARKEIALVRARRRSDVGMRERRGEDRKGYGDPDSKTAEERHR